MFYSIKGVLKGRKTNFAVIELQNMSFRVFLSPSTLAALPEVGTTISLFASLYWREDTGPELYGFMSEGELELFERLKSISGIGPKSALAILSIAKLDQLIAAINEGRTELLTHASGVGKKTAERIVLELKGKLEMGGSAQLLTLMESDVELEETLLGLGYSRVDARKAIGNIPSEVKGFKERLKAALKKK